MAEWFATVYIADMDFNDRGGNGRDCICQGNRSVRKRACIEYNTI